MYTKSRGFVKDIDRTELLAMREQGMSNQEIAKSLAVSYTTIFNLIGRQPKELTDASRCRGQSRRQQAIRESRMGTPVQMATSPMRNDVREEEPRKCILVMKSLPPAPIPLHGEFMDYIISADRTSVDVETEHGRCLLQIPMDKIGTFIAELNAIKRNVGAGTTAQFWG